MPQGRNLHFADHDIYVTVVLLSGLFCNLLTHLSLGRLGAS